MHHMVTIEIVINSIRVMGVRVAISCQYCIALGGDAFVSSCSCFLLLLFLEPGMWSQSRRLRPRDSLRPLSHLGLIGKRLGLSLGSRVSVWTIRPRAHPCKETL